MDIRRLEIFLKLLDTRSFSKTAAALGLTQPSVSASLKALEESLGQKLFERTPRAVTPLSAARVLAPYALNIVETMGRAAWAVGHQLANPREKLALGASSVPALVFIPPALAAFRRQYPGVLIKLQTGQSHGIARKVADGELDLALVGAPPENEELRSDPFARDQLVLLAAESLAAEVGPPPRTVEDLLAWPLILREEGSGTRAAFLSALGEEAGRLAGRMDIRAEVEGLGPALALVRAAFGATVISNLLLPRKAEAKKSSSRPSQSNGGSGAVPSDPSGILDLRGLTAMPLDFFGRRQLYLIQRRTARPSPALAALIGLLKKERG